MDDGKTPFGRAAAPAALLICGAILTFSPVAALAQRNAPTLPSTRATISGTLTLTGTQTIAQAGDCSRVEVTISGDITGTTDDGGGLDQLDVEVWDDGTMKDSELVSVPVGTTQTISVTLSFLGLYLSGAPGVGVIVVDIPSGGVIFNEDPFFPTDVAGVCPKCPAAPQVVCDAAQIAQFQYKDKDPINKPDKRKLKFVFNHGSAADTSAFGDPTVDTEFTLCVYENGDFSQEVTVPAGANWTATGAKGFKYKNKAANDIQKIKLKAGAVGSPQATTVQFKGKGSGLPALNLPLSEPVTIQVINSSNANCFGAEFPTASKNSDTAYKAKN